MRTLLLRIVLALTPSRWRDSIAGDFEEEGALRHVVPVIARLWLEELIRPRRRERRRFHMHAFSMEVRQAARSLAKRPGYSLVVITTLAIGIGANAAVFGLANWLLFRPLPAVQDPSRLATIRLTPPPPSGGVMTISHPEMEILRSHVPAIGEIAGSMEMSLDAAPHSGEAERVYAAVVSANYFEVLGLRPFAGRMFSASDPGIVISHAYWRRRMASSADAVGKTIFINGKAQPILGIAPAGVAGTSRTSSVDLWAPSTLRTVIFPGYRTDPLTTIRTGIYIELIARLAPGAQLEDLRRALAPLPAIIAKMTPRPQKYETGRFFADEGLSARRSERLQLGTIFSLLMSMVGLLLLLTCANVGNVMLAAGSTRRAEFATRQALGAGRGRIIQAVLIESLLLSLAGGAVALALAAVISAMMRGTIVLPFLPALGEITLDARVFAFALAASTVCAAGAGLLPALSATRLDPLAVLRTNGRSASQSSHGVRKALTIAQVAVSLTLLVGALLLARSVQSRRSVDTGFDPASVMTFTVDPGLHMSDDSKIESFYASLLPRTAAVPGVSGAALGWSRPFGPFNDTADVRTPDGLTHETVGTGHIPVGPGYFDTMGMPLLAGRGFAESDRPLEPGEARDAVISAALAKRLFGSPAAAIDRRIALETEDGRTRRIIGVATDARVWNAFRAPQGMVYSPLMRAPARAAIHVRIAAPPELVAPGLREALRQIDPAIPLYDMMTVREAIDRQMSEEILIGRLAIAFALIATLLAAVGLYGMLAQAVAERRIEIGIRAALGAAPVRVVRLIASDAFVMTSIGTGAGIMLAAWLSRYLESRLFGIDRFDPFTFAAAIALTVLVALVSAAIPASRAARVDPVIALRR